MKTIKTILFWIMSCTWGIIMTLIGLLTALGLIIAGNKPKRFGYGFYFEVGKEWGGVSLGPVFLTEEFADNSLKQHEAGHGVQNIWFGPFMPFVIGIPSMIRYWFREICGTKTQTERYRFVFRWFGILILLGVILTVLCAFTFSTLIGFIGFIVGAGITVYAIILLIWLIESEIPKYEIYIPAYNDIWFERSASKIGAKRWQTYKI